MARGSSGHSRIYFDGPVGGYGRDIDGLEGFARTFLLAGFILKGSSGEQGRDAAEWYARGLATGVDPDSPERWTRLDEHPQAKVEAASIALILDMTRDWIWDELSDATRQRVIDYLSPAVGDQTYPQINWVWFRLVVQTFLKSVGGPYSSADMEADLATHDSFARADGWLADGDERSFDHYTGWALHLYPTLWAQMRGAEAMAAARGTVDRDRLDRYLTDALALVGVRRCAASPGAQPDVPLRCRRAVLDRGDGGRAEPSTRRAPPRRTLNHRPLRRERLARRAGRPHDRLAPPLARARAGVLGSRVAVLGEQGDARPRSRCRPSRLVRR